MNRTLPWNQLGKDIRNTNTIEEALVSSDLNFKVTKKPIYDNAGNIINGYFANTRDDNNDVLGIVKKNYQIVQNLDAFDFTSELLNNGIKFERAGQFHHGKASWLLASMKDVNILGDTFDPYIIFVNSFDGSGAIKIAMVPIRIACSNALNMALKSASRSWSTKHTGNIYYKLDEARHTMGLANKYLTELNAEAERLAKIKVDDNKFDKIISKILPIDVMNDSERKIRNIEEIRSAIKNCLNAPDLANFYDTAWGKINAVTDAIDHISPSRMTENFAENNWSKIANGHNIVDSFYKELSA